MIGDNLHTDMMFAKNCMIDSALVMTGVTKADKESDLKRISKVRPTYVLQSLSEIITK